MKRFRWAGEDCNLGSFGFVRRGDVLHLTESEADGIVEDKRYKPLPIAIKSDPAPPGDLARANDPEAIAMRELLSMKEHELRKLAWDLHQAGQIPDYKRWYTRDQLIRIIVKSKKNPAPEPEPAGAKK